MDTKTNLKLREYQENILETCKNNNSLVVIPTGLGKTKLGIALALYRLEKFPESKVLMCSPTKPLCTQICNEFKEDIKLEENSIVLLTGQISPSKRESIYENAKIIIATPQTIVSDLNNNKINLSNFSCLIIDEAHRSREKYANTILAKNYIENSKFPRILALTASPGSTKEKINEIKENLFIDAVEIRTESDEDIKSYVQDKKIEWVNVDLPKEFEDIQKLIKEAKDKKINELRRIIPNKSVFTKKDLLDLQIQFRKSINKGNKTSFWGVSLTAQLLKLSYALELIETQGINQLIQYLDKLKKEETKAARTILNDIRIKKVLQLTSDFKENKHPKMEKLREIIKEELNKDKNSKIIIFANYRNTIDEIYNEIKKEELIKPVILIGQKEGLSQKEQKEVIKKFEDNVYNIMIGSSILEEGISVKGGANLCIFFDQVYGIRRIQRVGRVARTIPGKVIFLITNKTRDTTMYWKSKRDISKMTSILKEMQSEQENQTRLYKF